MSLWEYAAMLLELGVVAAALAIGAVRTRRRLIPHLRGAPARLAEVGLALATLTIVLQLLGLAGLLRTATLLATCLIAAGAMAAWGDGGTTGHPFSVRRESVRVALAVGGTVCALLLLAWAQPALEGARGGMTDGDTLWYHMPFAARFAQDGSITALHYTGPNYLSWFYPATGELFHTFGLLVAGNHDLLSPLLALAWLGLGLLAAWCVGVPFGVAPLTLVAGAVVFAGPLLVEREPGAVRTDAAGVALLLATAALLLNAPSRSRPDLGTLAVAGLTAGLAVGTKLTLLPPIAVLSIGVVLVSRLHRLRRSVVWLGCLAATGSFWYMRNLVEAGNPLPWTRIGLGPFTLAGPGYDPAADSRSSVLDYIADERVWREYFLPGLDGALGKLWPAVLLLGAAGALLSCIRGKPIQRVLGAAAVVGAVAYVVNPLSAPGPEGAPSTFESNLRYLLPPLALGLVLLPTTVRLGRPTAWLAGGFGLFMTTGAVVNFGPHFAEAVALTVALAVCTAAAVALVYRRRRITIVLAALTLASLAAAVWPLARDHLDDRYLGLTSPKLTAPGMHRAYRWARGLSDARIATTSVLQYGLYGDDLSNHVRYLGQTRANGGFIDPPSCEAWRSALNAGAYDYLVFAPEYIQAAASAPASWARSPSLERIHSWGPTTIFRVRGAIDAAGCRNAATAVGDPSVKENLH